MRKFFIFFSVIFSVMVSFSSYVQAQEKNEGKTIDSLEKELMPFSHNPPMQYDPTGTAQAFDNATFAVVLEDLYKITDSLSLGQTKSEREWHETVLNNNKEFDKLLKEVEGLKGVSRDNIREINQIRNKSIVDLSKKDKQQFAKNINNLKRKLLAIEKEQRELQQKQQQQLEEQKQQLEKQEKQLEDQRQQIAEQKQQQDSFSASLAEQQQEVSAVMMLSEVAVALGSSSMTTAEEAQKIAEKSQATAEEAKAEAKEARKLAEENKNEGNIAFGISALGTLKSINTMLFGEYYFPPIKKHLFLGVNLGLGHGFGFSQKDHGVGFQTGLKLGFKVKPWFFPGVFLNAFGAGGDIQAQNTIGYGGGGSVRFSPLLSSKKEVRFLIELGTGVSHIFFLEKVNNSSKKKNRISPVQTISIGIIF